MARKKRNTTKKYRLRLSTNNWSVDIPVKITKSGHMVVSSYAQRKLSSVLRHGHHLGGGSIKTRLVKPRKKKKSKSRKKSKSTSTKKRHSTNKKRKSSTSKKRKSKKSTSRRRKKRY